MSSVDISIPGTSDPIEATQERPTLSDYARVAGFLAIHGLGLVAATRAGWPTHVNALIAPIGAMVGITAVVWLAMIVVRNYWAIRGSSHPPAEWVERPARAFNNLMQMPTLFYVVCILMMITQRVDAAALALSWLFVLTRALHAMIFIVWDHVPSRFATWIASANTLIVLWVRFLAG